MPDFPFQYEIINKFNKPYLKMILENRTQEITAEEALSYLFKDIKMNAESFLNEKVTHAVFSVQDNFGDDQQLALKAAANKGGLNILKTVKDSVAAIYGYQLNEIAEEKNILIIDVGAKSMNLVLNVVENNNIELLGQKFIDKFGENYFVNKLSEYIMAQYDNIVGTTLKNEDVVKELKYKAKELTETLNVFHSVDFIWRSVDIDLNTDIRITRAKFDELAHFGIKNILDSITALLFDVEIKRSDVSQVILLGSVFKIPKLRNEIRNYFYGLDMRVEKDFEETVVEGCAIVGFIARGIELGENVVYFDVLSENLGIEVYNKMFHIVVPQGSPIPLKVSQQFTITSDNQKEVNIKILEGDRLLTRGNSFLGEVTFNTITSGLRSLVLFNVEFDIRENGVIIFTSTDLESGQSKSVFIERDFEKYGDGGSGRVPVDGDDSLEKEKRIRIVNELRFQVESIAYEIRSHLKNDTFILRKIKSPIDYLLVQQSVQETILWLENHSTSDVIEMKMIKEKFESTIKPILVRAFGE